MAWKKRKKAQYDEFDDEYEDEYDDDYEDEYEEKYDEYDDDYEDEEDEEDDDYLPRRNPLKPLVIALLLLLVVMAALVGILFMRLQNAEGQVTDLTASLNATRTELNNLLAEKTAATPEPAPTPEPTPEATPEPTPEPTPTSEPTPEPTPTPEPPLKDAVTDEILNGLYRPKDNMWLDKAKPSVVTNDAFQLALRWGPGTDWFYLDWTLTAGNKVEVLAKSGNWSLIRTTEGKYGWTTSAYLRDATDEEIAAWPRTESPAAPAAATDDAGMDDAGMYDDMT